jgi:hypothetical protein
VDNQKKAIPTALEDAAREAVAGNRSALDKVVRELQGDICGITAHEGRLRAVFGFEDVS